jgi:hypothetical protein
MHAYIQGRSLSWFSTILLLISECLLTLATEQKYTGLLGSERSPTTKTTFHKKSLLISQKEITIYIF